MNIKKLFSLFVIAMLGFIGVCKVDAVTISDDGKYTLILTSTAENASIDGKDQKIIKFNVVEGETTVKLSELTKDVVVFNGSTEFSHWETAGGEKVSDDIAITEFRWSDEAGTYTLCSRKIKQSIIW